MSTARVRTEGFQLVIRELGTLPDRALTAVERGLSRGLQYAVGIAQRRHLSGPRPKTLDVVTTRLRNSLTHRVRRLPDRITGEIGTAVPYGRFHELGFRGTQQVRAHTRVVRESISAQGRIVDVDSRRQVRDSQGRAIGFKDRRRGRVEGTTNTTVNVRAHSRRINYAGRPFLRPALEAAMPRIIREINSGVAEALQGGGK